MPRAAPSFSQTDLTRLLKGMKNAAVEISKIEIEPHKVTVFIKLENGAVTETALDGWRRSHGAG
jgi:hypothetical protein